MEQGKAWLTERIVEAVQELPEEKMAEVLDFAAYLQSKYAARRAERGSPEAILQALRETGGLQFEPGELDALLAEIEESRESDLADRGEPERL